MAKLNNSGISRYEGVPASFRRATLLTVLSVLALFATASGHPQSSTAVGVVVGQRQPGRFRQNSGDMLARCRWALKSISQKRPATLTPESRRGNSVSVRARR